MYLGFFVGFCQRHDGMCRDASSGRFAVHGTCSRRQGAAEEAGQEWALIGKVWPAGEADAHAEQHTQKRHLLGNASRTLGHSHSGQKEGERKRRTK